MVTWPTKMSLHCATYIIMTRLFSPGLSIGKDFECMRYSPTCTAIPSTYKHVLIKKEKIGGRIQVVIYVHIVAMGSGYMDSKTTCFVSYYVTSTV